MAVSATSESATYFKGFKVLMDQKGVAFERNYSPICSQEKSPLSNARAKPVRVVPLRYSKSSFTLCNALHSANSPYSHQEIPTTATPLTSSSQVDAVRAISDDLQNLERKLERERDRRTNTESLGVAKFETKISRLKLLRPVAPPESPIEKATSCLSYTGNKECTVTMNILMLYNATIVLGDDMNNSEVHKRNGFRPSARGTFFTRDHHPSTNPTLTNLNNDNLLAMGALAISTPPSASSRKQQQISKDIRISQTKSKGTMTLPLGRERTKQPKYVYTDAVSGATPAFQQRISEIASLENETLRYERTRKLKKKTKQERD
ncbi:uncharacterized protein LOC117119824 isoform X4 [Anneissia japonica]|uniref:uncharacterized protein LOC117119824 isoform X4 n=1 Tax=Anneissia japonica TaxID=1529436 RepID=UPI001425734E|nr:uncharacterized protein LOC117119824 isoform X4 [Anneissia japonica]